MSQNSGSKPKPFQSKTNKSSRSKKVNPRLTLVVSNADTIQEKAPAFSQSTPSNTGFTTAIRKKGYDLYEMNILDPFHDFGCDLVLEIEARDGATTAICHFPTILNESNKFLDEDETLYGAIMIQFQLKVLGELFMFCAVHDACQLIIYMDDDQAEGFGVYQNFLVHCDETLMERGEQTEMVISRKAFAKWRSFIKKTNIELEQHLWCQQQFNPAIRRYLKARAHG